jgi:SAM-dependent methyltransferase
MSDTDAFHAFELAGWQRAAAAYADAFGGLTAQAIEPLLDAVGAAQRSHVLDVATGPGYVAAAAARRGAKVVGVDFSRAMVEHAQRAHSGVDFREGDAEALPFEPNSFDAVVASFGLLHFARPERALREMHRVLRPGGRVGLTVWARPERTVGFRIVLDALAAHGDAATTAPPGPPFFRFSDPGQWERALGEAGFASAAIVEVPMIWQLPSPDALFHALTEGAVRFAASLNAQSQNARTAIQRAVVSEASRFRSGNGIELAMPCVLASAVASGAICASHNRRSP